MKLVSSKILSYLNLENKSNLEKMLGVNFGAFFRSDIKIDDKYLEFNPTTIDRVDESSFLSRVKKLKRGDLLMSINDYCILSSKQHPSSSWLNSKNGEVISTNELPFKDGDIVKVTFLSKKVNKLNQQKTLFIDPEEATFDKEECDVEFNWCYSVDLKNYEKIMNRIEILKIKSLGDKIKSKVFNQDKSVDEIIKCLKINVAGLKEKNKPIGAYLLTGPTGTGKTELAKVLANELDWNLVKIDMSEYIQSHSISRLIGSPPSYVGYGDKSILETEVHNKKVVLLLDEMEKAHQDVQKVFLQAMDNAKVTLGNGNEVDFSKVLIVMTSNCGVVQKNDIGLVKKESLLSVNYDEIKNYFIPEFIGRLNGILEFNPIDLDTCNRILSSLIKDFSKSLEEKNINVVFTDSAKELLLKNGFNKNYGARPLKNYFKNSLMHKVVDKIFENELCEFHNHFGSRITVSAVMDDFYLDHKHLSLVDLIRQEELC